MRSFRYAASVSSVRWYLIERSAQDQDFPVDVAEQLAQLKPHVDIDENYGRRYCCNVFSSAD